MFERSVFHQRGQCKPLTLYLRLSLCLWQVFPRSFRSERFCRAPPSWRSRLPLTSIELTWGCGTAKCCMVYRPVLIVYAEHQLSHPTRFILCNHVTSTEMISGGRRHLYMMMLISNRGRRGTGHPAAQAILSSYHPLHVG